MPAYCMNKIVIINNREYLGIGWDQIYHGQSVYRPILMPDIKSSESKGWRVQCICIIFVCSWPNWIGCTSMIDWLVGLGLTSDTSHTKLFLHEYVISLLNNWISMILYAENILLPFSFPNAALILMLLFVSKLYVYVISWVDIALVAFRFGIYSIIDLYTHNISSTNPLLPPKLSIASSFFLHLPCITHKKYCLPSVFLGFYICFFFLSSPLSIQQCLYLVK